MGTVGDDDAAGVAGGAPQALAISSNNVAQGFSPAFAALQGCATSEEFRFISGSVYLPARSRSSAARARTFVALIRSLMRHDSSG